MPARSPRWLAAGGVFPIPEALIGRVGRLPGVGDGKQKMSKSLGNAIFLSDNAKLDPATAAPLLGRLCPALRDPLSDLALAARAPAEVA